MNILGLGLPEIIIIALVLLLFFGQKRLPGLFRSLGSSISELKRGLQDTEDNTPNRAEPSPDNDTHAQPAHNTPSTANDVPTKKNTTTS